MQTAFKRSGSVLAMIALCFCAACQSHKEEQVSGPKDTSMSPAAIVTDAQPWKRGEQIARAVPNSDVYVGHGDSMLPLYPSGTVVVVQRVQLDHLREGMTVIFSKKTVDPFSMVANVLEKRHKDGTWIIEGISAGSSRYRVRLTDANYVGTVVAAIRSPDNTKPFAERELVMTTSSLYCALQCHIDGEVHPRIIPRIPLEESDDTPAEAGSSPTSL